MQRLLCSLMIILLATSNALSQFFYSGQDPASVRWQIMKTPHFSVLFPDSTLHIAQQLAGALEQNYERGAYSLNATPRRITVVLHPSDIFSNAFVAWAPRRIEMVSTPPQDNYSQDWIQQLALHEYRHLVQLTALNQGLTRVLSWFFGEQITAGIMGTFVPFWFIEGDATLTETLLGESGRGRQPSFDAPLRAQLLEHGPYHYDKAVFGSYKDFVPDHYVLGYHLVTMARRDYGATIWQNAVRKAGRVPVMITPFNRGIRLSSGLSKVGLYKKVMHELDSLWRRESSRRKLSPASTLSPLHRHYTSYRQPVGCTSGKVIAFRYGTDETTKVVEFGGSEKEHVLFHVGHESLCSLSANDSTVLWAEAGYDPRWENRTYSNIWRFDRQQHRKKKLTRRSRLFAPALSPDGRQFVCVAVDLQNIHALQIRSTRDGKLITEQRYPEGIQLMTPAWSGTGDSIVCIRMQHNQKKLLLCNVQLQALQLIFPAPLKEFSDPVLKGHQIYFSSGSEGIDNIYCYNLQTEALYPVTSVSVSAVEPSILPDTNLLLFADCHADGYRIVAAPADPCAAAPDTDSGHISERIFMPLLSQEMQTPATFDTLVHYPVKRYYKFLHLFNPHSWGPLSVNADRQSVNPGLTLMSQNKLSTLTATLGWEYSINERRGTWFAEASFSQWYPIIDLRYATGLRRAPHPDLENTDYQWQESSLRTSIRVPLNLSSGRWSRWAQLRVSSTWYEIRAMDHFPDNYFSGYMRTLDYQLYWSQQALQAPRDVESRWGQMIVADYRHTPFDGLMLGDMYALRSTLYFPGIGRHHSFYLNLSYQQNTTKPYKYADLITYPRGVRDAYDDRFGSMSLNYSLPLLFPDLHLGPVFYLKRIWMNAYFDYAEGVYKNRRNYYSSAGMECYFNLHLFRFLAPFQLGFRGSWVFGRERFVPEFLYSLDISGIQ